MDKKISFEINEANGTRYIQLTPFLEIPSINHGFFTRVGGVSPYPYCSLNFKKDGDSQNNIIKNIDIVSTLLCFDPNNLISVRQVQSDGILVIRDHILDIGTLCNRQCDAIITNIPNIALSVKTGDCLPVLFTNTDGTVVGIAHAGWRGTMLRITNKVLSVLEDVFGQKKGEIMVGLGPSIGSCCYEVGQELFQKFLEADFRVEECFYERDGKLFLDIKTANIEEIVRFGVPRSHVFSVNLCTSCQNEDFFSHRRDKGITGRQINIIALS